MWSRSTACDTWHNAKESACWTWASENQKVRSIRLRHGRVDHSARRDARGLRRAPSTQGRARYRSGSLDEEPHGEGEPRSGPRARSHASPVSLHERNCVLLLVERGNGQRCQSLSVALVCVHARLEQILKEFPTAITSRVVQGTVAVRVHGKGICSAIQQELCNGDAVGADGVAERSDASVVLHVQGLHLGEELLHRVHVPVPGGLVQRLLGIALRPQRRMDLARKAARLLADPQHEVLILVVPHNRIEPVLLDIGKYGRQVRILLQGLESSLQIDISALEPGAVVLGHGLHLHPSPKGLRISSDLPQRPGQVRIVLQVLLDFAPSCMVQARNADEFH
mmetsp:Transcript_35437/g.110503  ORF Transcript_35437/g.110503 Transcript_35437/m.110503 type:complete len:338 (+) Transcript_35437:137-1150(+)